jgi:hypothetical protein
MVCSALKEEMRALEADKAKAVQEAQALKERQRRDAASCRRDTEGTKAAVDHARKAQAAMGTCRGKERGVCGEDVSFAEGIGMFLIVCVAAEDLKALKQRLKSAEEEATILRQTLDATSRATQRDLDEIAALRSENEALRTHQGTLQKVG